MAIFSRRVLQRMLDATEHLLTPAQRDRRLRLLNAANDESLDTEWEVVLVYGLSQLGSLHHEREMPGSARPDLLFEREGFEFVVDIAAVNDRAYEEANPLDRFQKEFWRRLRKAGLPTGAFSYHVEADRSGIKTRLLLPRNNQWGELFDENFKNLLQWAKLEPTKPIGLRRKTADMDVTFRYTPGQQYGGGGHSPFRTSSSATQNPIFNALKRKKEQLKDSQYEGLLGIVICDAGCEQLRNVDRILKRFFRDTTSIAFVIVCTIDGDRFGGGPIRLKARCHLNPKRTNEAWCSEVARLFEVDLPAVLPKADDDVTNAINYLRWKRQHAGLGHHGGFAFWGDRYMRISSRALHELLAGTVSCEEFMRKHRFVEEDGRPDINPFAGFLNEGRMISAIHVDASDEEDDDWLVFEFGERDAAISKFRSVKSPE